MDESDHLVLVNAGDDEVVSQEEEEEEEEEEGRRRKGFIQRRRERGAPKREKEEGVVARALSLSHTCGHAGRTRTVLDWVVLR